MKKIILSLVIFSFMPTAFGILLTTEKQAEAAFSNYIEAQEDAELMAIIDNYDERGLRLLAFDSVELSSFCGFAGCDYSFLVTANFASQFVVNGQTRAILAVVRVPAIGEAKVEKIISLPMLLNQ